MVGKAYFSWRGRRAGGQMNGTSCSKCWR